MTDYIKRDDALKSLYTDYAYAAVDVIKRLPAADVAKVVHCKDCKYVNFTESRDYLQCTKHCAFSFRPNDFCSYGERRASDD